MESSSGGRIYELEGRSYLVLRAGEADPVEPVGPTVDEDAERTPARPPT